MKKELLYLLVIISFLSGCKHSNTYCIGVGRSDWEVCDDVHLSKGDTVAWTTNGIPNCEIEIEGKYFHYHEDEETKTEYILCDDWIYGTIIRGHIVDYATNDDCLLADQKPIDSILGKEIPIYHEDGSYWYSRREYDTTNRYDDYWKMLENSPAIHQYWILVFATADVYGPLSFDEYLDMKNKLGVPPTLKLKCEKQTNANK